MNVIEAKELAVQAGSKYILSGINWTIEEGDRWFLFGLNGCGKTTLLSILSGFHSKSEGELTLFGQTPTADNITVLRQRIGWASASFFERYIRCENTLDIVLASKQGTLGISDETITDDDVRKAKRLLRELGLKKQLRYPYDLLSRGQKQKVLLARAMMSQGDVLLLDEPCGGLDILSRQMVLHELERLMEQEHKALVYVSHHFDEIRPFFNKAMLLKDGQIHSQGALRQVISSNNLTDFFGIPAAVTETNACFALQLDMEGFSIDGKKKSAEEEIS